MRELTTIGSLAAVRSMRAIDRSSRLLPLRGIGFIGQSNPGFAPPADLSATTASAGALDAANTLMQNFSGSGTPTETTVSPVVQAFQSAWNGDPLVSAAGGNALLSVDGEYGPNTRDAVAAINGGSAPAVNAGGAPAPAPLPVPVTPAAPVVPASSSSGGHALLWALAIAAAVAVAWALRRTMKKRRGRRRALPARAIVLT